MAKGFHNIRTEMAKHIRGRLKQMGIRARVDCCPSNRLGVRVFTHGPRVEFSENEQRAIIDLALVLGLTGIRGLAASCNPYGTTFYLTAERIAQAADLIRKYPSIYVKAA